MTDTNDIDQLLDSLNGEPPAGDSPADQPPATTPAAITADDLRTVVNEALAANQPAAQQRPATDYSQVSPETLARMAVREEMEMIDEVRQMYPNAPASVIEQLKAELSGLETAEELRNTRTAGGHRMLADHLMAEATRRGQTNAPVRVLGGESITETGMQTRVDPQVKEDLKELTAIFQSVAPNFKFTNEMVTRGLSQ